MLLSQSLVGNAVDCKMHNIILSDHAPLSVHFTPTASELIIIPNPALQLSSDVVKIELSVLSSSPSDEVVHSSANVSLQGCKLAVESTDLLSL